LEERGEIELRFEIDYLTRFLGSFNNRYISGLGRKIVTVHGVTGGPRYTRAGH
jgi:hypothetical protein